MLLKSTAEPVCYLFTMSGTAPAPQPRNRSGRTTNSSPILYRRVHTSVFLSCETPRGKCVNRRIYSYCCAGKGNEKSGVSPALYAFTTRRLGKFSRNGQRGAIAAAAGTGRAATGEASPGRTRTTTTAAGT